MLIEITNACDEGCRHCFNSSTPNGGMMDFETFKKIVNFFAINGITAINISGGEPFLHPELGKFLKYVSEEYHRRNKRFVITIITNGTWCLNENQLERAKEIIKKTYVGIVAVSTNKKYYKNYKLVKEFFETNKIDKVIFEANWQGTYTNIIKLGRASNMRPKTISHPNCYDIKQYFIKAYESKKKFGEVINDRAMEGHTCYPAFDYNGNFRLGVSRFCESLFNISSIPKNISALIRTFDPYSCDKCKACKVLDNSLKMESELSNEDKAKLAIMRTLPLPDTQLNSSIQFKRLSMHNTSISASNSIIRGLIDDFNFRIKADEVYKYVASISYYVAYNNMWLNELIPDELDKFKPQIDEIERKYRLFETTIQKTDSKFDCMDVVKKLYKYLFEECNFFDTYNAFYKYYEREFMRFNISSDMLPLQVQYVGVLFDRAKRYYSECSYKDNDKNFKYYFIGKFDMRSPMDELLYIANHCESRANIEDVKRYEEYLTSLVGEDGNIVHNENTKELLDLVDHYDDVIVDGVFKGLRKYGYL